MEIRIGQKGLSGLSAGEVQHDRDVVGIVVAAVDLEPGAAVPRAHLFAAVEHGLPVIVVAYCVLHEKIHGGLFSEVGAPPHPRGARESA